MNHRRISAARPGLLASIIVFVVGTVARTQTVAVDASAPTPSPVDLRIEMLDHTHCCATYSDGSHGTDSLAMKWAWTLSKVYYVDEKGQGIWLELTTMKASIDNPCEVYYEWANSDHSVVCSYTINNASTHAIALEGSYAAAGSYKTFLDVAADMPSSNSGPTIIAHVELAH